MSLCWVPSWWVSWRRRSTTRGSFFLFIFRVTKRFGKKSPNFLKSSPNSLQAIERPKYLQQSSVWKPKTCTWNHFWNLWKLWQTMFWNCSFGWKLNKVTLTKSSPKFCHFFGLLHHSKNYNEPPKEAQLKKKISESGHPVNFCFYQTIFEPAKYWINKSKSENGMLSSPTSLLIPQTFE